MTVNSPSSLGLYLRPSLFKLNSSFTVVMLDAFEKRIMIPVCFSFSEFSTTLGTSCLDEAFVDLTASWLLGTLVLPLQLNLHYGSNSQLRQQHWPPTWYFYLQIILNGWHNAVIINIASIFSVKMTIFDLNILSLAAHNVTNSRIFMKIIQVTQKSFGLVFLFSSGDHVCFKNCIPPNDKQTY